MEQFSNAVLAVRHGVKINSQQNRMIFAAIFAVNKNVVCRHKIPLVWDNLPNLAKAIENIKRNPHDDDLHVSSSLLGCFIEISRSPAIPRADRPAIREAGPFVPV